MSENTIVLKLINGQEIMAEVISSTAETITLNNVQTLEVGAGPGGQVQLVMYPWSITSPSGEIEVQNRTIAARIENATISKQLLDLYIQRTTGISIASSQPGIIV